MTDTSEVIEIQGLKLSPMERTRNGSPGRRPARIGGESSDDVVCPHSAPCRQGVTPRLPLELFIYNHKKAKENATKRILAKIDRSRKKNMLLKKVHFSEMTSKRNIVPENTFVLDVADNNVSNPNPHELGIDPNEQVMCGCHADADNQVTCSCHDHVRCNCHDQVTCSCHADPDEPCITTIIDAVVRKTSTESHDQHHNQGVGGSTYRPPASLHNPHNPENPPVRLDTVSGLYDTAAIKSVTSSNRRGRHCHPPSPRHAVTNTPTLFPWLHESYSGYVHRNNKLCLTRKCVPTTMTFSPVYHQRTDLSLGGKAPAGTSRQVSFLWGDLVPGTLVVGDPKSKQPPPLLPSLTSARTIVER